MRFAALFTALAFLALAAPHSVSKAEVEKMMTDLSNWGRWGKADEKGTYNLITPQKRREAAALVKDGVAVSLAHDTLLEKAPDNDAPFIHKMTYTGAHPNGDWFMDQYTVSF